MGFGVFAVLNTSFFLSPGAAYVACSIRIGALVGVAVGAVVGAVVGLAVLAQGEVAVGAAVGAVVGLALLAHGDTEGTLLAPQRDQGVGARVGK